MKGFYVGAAAIALAGAAFSQERTVIPIGVDLGVYLPQDSTVKSVFGDAWYRVGITPLSLQTPDNWKFTMDVAYLRSSRQGNRASLLPVTFGMTRAFGQDNDVRPYVALRAGPYWGDVNSPFLGINKSKIGIDANAAVGLAFKNGFYIEARYDTMSKFEGLNFSGFFFSAGIKLFDIRL